MSYLIPWLIVLSTYLISCSTSSEQEAVEQEVQETQDEQEEENQQSDDNNLQEDDQEENQGQEEDLEDEDLEEEENQFDNDNDAGFGNEDDPENELDSEDEDIFGEEDVLQTQDDSQEDFNPMAENMESNVNFLAENGEDNSNFDDTGESVNSSMEENLTNNQSQAMAQPFEDQSMQMSDDSQTMENFSANNSQQAESPKPSDPMVQTFNQERVDEVFPVYHSLTWVGYEIDEQSRKLTISMITNGTPDYEVFQEQNRSVQPELVVRFFQTSLRRKIKWDIDASEFRSPIAYIRMREEKQRGYVDVVITMRDPVEGTLFSKNGDVTLNFPIPDYYFGNMNIVQRKLNEKAELIGKAEISLKLDRSSDIPRNVERGASGDLEPVEGRSINDSLSPERSVDPNGLPDNFSSGLNLFDPNEFVLGHYSILGVGQDNGEDVEENQQENQLNQQEENQQDQQEENQLEDNQFNDQEENQQEIQENQQEEDPLANQEELEQLNFQQENTNNTQGLNGVEVQENIGSLDGNNAEIEALNSSDLENVDGGNLNNGQFQDEVNNGFEDNENVIVEELEASDANGELLDDVNSEPVGTASARVNENEKLIFMEFTDAPLSLILKSFSEETGNNFIFPNAVGDLTVSIHFKGVPWDEALKAILETHSLGMVRVGESIVRVDEVEKLTSYLQTLERAQQFEARRTPTKILVFRLNNAVAADIVGRINELIIRDKQIDPRIQVSADERTNSVVMEAPDYVLAKTKSIIERLDLKTPQVEITSRIVEVQKTNSDLFGVAWLNQSLLNFDPGRGLGFGSLNFPNSVTSSFAVDPGVRATPSVGNAQFKFGSINKFIDLDLLLRMEERRGTTNVLQSNRVLVLDGQEALILAGNSKFFRPAAGAVVGGGEGAAGEGAEGLSEVKFNLSLEVKPQVTADGSVIMDLLIQSDTPGAPTGEVLADKNTRELKTQMVRESGDTGVIGGIYDTSKTETIVGVPFLSSLPIVGALFRSTNTEESQTELLIMVTPTIVTSDKKDSSETASRSENFDNVNF